MPPRRRLFLVAVLAIVLVGVAWLGLRLIDRDTPSGRPDQTRPGTVLLIPGYGGSPVAVSRLADRLRAAGKTAIVVAPPGDGTGDLRVQADALDRAVRQALRDGAPSVDLIGYSAGGVVARLWLDRHDGDLAARRIISLGSPLRGARIADAAVAMAPDACPIACRQLARGSDLIADLHRNPISVPWLSVWTENDETVEPPDSARLEGAINVPIQSLCPAARVSHGQLPTDPIVTVLVLQALSADEIAVPGGCPA
jgi:alpha-beta hydrolase superfamily lysophospholipase